MQWAALAENRPQQIDRYFAVDGLARFDVHGQGHLALNDDERADVVARHGFGGVGQAVGDRIARRLRELTQQTITAQYHQATPQLRLEDDQQPQQPRRQQIIEDVAQDEQIEARDDEVSNEEQAHDE